VRRVQRPRRGTGSAQSFASMRSPPSRHYAPGRRVTPRTAVLRPARAARPTQDPVACPEQVVGAAVTPPAGAAVARTPAVTEARPAAPEWAAPIQPAVTAARRRLAAQAVPARPAAMAVPARPAAMAVPARPAAMAARRPEAVAKGARAMLRAPAAAEALPARTPERCAAAKSASPTSSAAARPPADFARTCCRGRTARPPVIEAGPSLLRPGRLERLRRRHSLNGLAAAARFFTTRIGRP
jgi:hypothetical protein